MLAARETLDACQLETPLRRPRLPPIPAHEIEVVAAGNGRYDILWRGEKQGTASLLEAGMMPCMSLCMLDKAIQGRDVGKVVYDAIETDLGTAMVPSPLGLTEDAQNFWFKRIADVDPEVRLAMLREALRIGRSYEISDAHILVDRLDTVFRQDEIDAVLALEQAPAPRGP